MSKIDDLIRELSPGGVPFQPLSELTKLRAGERITKSQMKGTGRYPAYGGGMFPTGKFDFWNGRNSILISRAGAAGYVNFVEGEFWATDVCFVAEQKQGGPLIKFIYYWIKASQADLMLHTYGGSMPKLDKQYLWRYLVPVPPIEVQTEIVSILDKFNQLDAELLCELEARRILHESVRHAFFEFYGNNAPPIRLGETVSVKMCKRIYNSETSSSGEVPFFKIGTFGKEPDAYISRELFKDYRSKYPYPQAGEILISCSGTLGKVIEFDGQDAYFQDSNLVWLANDESLFLNRYLFHWMKAKTWNVSGGTIARLYAKDFTNLVLPCPTIENQQKLVSVLDKLEALVNDPSSGLPAEIEARRKQYEYYRNKLLTFRDLAAA